MKGYFMAITFSGFNTVDTDSSNNYKLYDIELVKRDILNHFFTRKGERVMRENFGCIIWDYLMEPLTEYVVDIIKKDARKICESDPRVSVINVLVTKPVEHSIVIELDLQYHPFDVVDKFVVEFNNKERGE